MNIKLVETTPKTRKPNTGNGYTATDDLWPTRVAGTTPGPAADGYTATDDLWK